jgi:hypothetical protein
VVGLKRVWSDGTSALVFSPSELVERLVDGFACPSCGGPPGLDAAGDDRKA